MVCLVGLLEVYLNRMMMLIQAEANLILLDSECSRCKACGTKFECKGIEGTECFAYP